jgi:hypothetical protein
MIYAAIGESMSLIDLFRQEYVRGKVLNKYSLYNGNLGLIIDDYSTHKRYHVEFKDGYKGPGFDNLYGVLKEPFSSKTQYLDNLIRAGDHIELSMSYSKGPFRQAYRLYSVSRSPTYNRHNPIFQTLYKYSNALHY